MHDLDRVHLRKLCIYYFERSEPDVKKLNYYGLINQMTIKRKENGLEQG